jgi:hypothetical protein
LLSINAFVEFTKIVVGRLSSMDIAFFGLISPPPRRPGERVDGRRCKAMLEDYRVLAPGTMVLGYWYTESLCHI